MTVTTEPKKTERVRHVLDTSMVAHVWAQQTQSNGRNKQNNFYFDGPTIYSYGDHFPIARFIEHREKRCVLVTTRTYSNTTAKHISETRNALRGLDIPVFHISNLNRYNIPDHATIWQGYLSTITKQVRKSSKARKWRASHLRQAKDTALEAIAYSSFFGLRKRLPKGLDAFLAKAESEIIEADKSTKAAESKRAKERAIQERERFAEWINDPSVEYDSDKTYLRVKPASFIIRDPQTAIELSTIETSRGAEFPVEHGKRAFKFIMECRATGSNWERNGHSIHLGHFVIDSIDSSGNVRAGCHTVAWDEIERIAKQLGI